MKNFKNLKQAVFILGFIALLVGAFSSLAGAHPMASFFPVYTGLFLMGTVLLHKEPKVNTVV